MLDALLSALGFVATYGQVIVLFVLALAFAFARDNSDPYDERRR